MIYIFKGTARVALAVSIFSVLGLTASAQQVLPHPNVAVCNTTNRSVPATNPGGTFPLANSGGLFYFDPAASGVTAVTWSTKGDLALDGLATTYLGKPAINVKAVAQGTATQPGYGKGQLIATYSVAGCAVTQSVTYDVYKTFTAPDPIVGPSCVVPGGTYAFSVLPKISSEFQIDQRIGIDKYMWSGWPTGAAVVLSGDKSAATVTMPTTLTAGFTVSVQVGQCNSINQTKVVGTAQALSAILAGNATTTCRLTNNSAVGNFTVNAVTGTTYAITLPAGWAFAAPVPAGQAGISIGANTGTVAGNGLIVLSFTSNGDAGTITALTTGTGCNSGQLASLPVRRELTALNVITDPGCLTKMLPVTISVAPAPANSFFYWTVPLGWMVNPGVNSPQLIAGKWRTSGPSISVTPTPVGGNISVNSGDASAACVSATPPTRLLRVNNGKAGTAANCGPFALLRLGPSQRSYYLTVGGSAAVSPCLPDGGSVNLYTWTATVASIVYTRVSKKGVMSNSPSAGNGTESEFGVDVPVNAPVTVRIVNPATCYDTLISFVSPLRPAGPGTRPGDEVRNLTPAALRGVQAGTQPGALGGTHELSSYPNPASEQLAVTLTASAQTPAEVTLVDALGRVVVRRKLSAATGSLSVKALPAGVYTLRAVFADGQSRSQHVQISH